MFYQDCDTLLLMAVRKTIIEEDTPQQPNIVKTTQTIVDPTLHTPVVEGPDVTIQTTTQADPTVKQTTVIREPLVKTEHPQKIYDKKKRIFRTYQIIWYVLIFVELLLGFRATLKAIGANPISGFVNLVYALSAPLVLPFSGIVPSYIDGNAIVEWSTMFAGVIYFLLAFGLVHLLQLAKPVTPEEVEENV